MSSENKEYIEVNVDLSICASKKVPIKLYKYDTVYEGKDEDNKPQFRYTYKYEDIWDAIESQKIEGYDDLVKSNWHIDDIEIIETELT